MDLQEIIKSIKEGVSDGLSFETLKSRYPLMTRRLYRKLGGMRSRQRPLNKNCTTDLVTLGMIHDPKDEGPWDDELLIGSLMGDGHIEAVTNGTYVYREGHCWAQIPYVAMKYYLLKPRSSSVTLKKPYKGFADYSIHITTVASSTLGSYRGLFYTEKVDGKLLPQKNTLREEIFRRMTPRAVAFWLMDDGKKYGSAKGCFELTVGRKVFHDCVNFDGLAGILSDILGFKIRARARSRSISFSNTAESLPRVLEVLAPLVHPFFAYKLGLEENEVGSSLRQSEWFRRWELMRTSAEHPMLESFPLSAYQSSTDPIFRERYLRAAVARTRVRGFPFPTLKQEDLRHAWMMIGEATVRDDGSILTCHPRVNSFPASFMGHRFKCAHKGRPSPYEVYSSNTLLRRTLECQLRDGPALEDTNIRNALCVYASIGLGQFNTGIARHLVEKYCPSGGVVLDPCAGWGNRLCGTVAAGRAYYGIEPYKKTFEALLRIHAWIEESGISREVTIVNSVAEDEDSYEGRAFQFAMTSPPYFDTERYSSEPTQSSIRYPVYEKWVDGFLDPMIRNVYRHLSPGAVFALNIADVGGYPLESNSIEIARSVGFSLEGVYRMGSYRRPGMRDPKSEPILILRKACMV